MLKPIPPAFALDIRSMQKNQLIVSVQGSTCPVTRRMLMVEIVQRNAVRQLNSLDRRLWNLEYYKTN